MADDMVDRMRSGMPPNCFVCDEYACVEPCNCACHDWQRLVVDAADEIERLRALCHDLYHDATCAESFCRLCGEGIREWEARRG